MEECYTTLLSKEKYNQQIQPMLSTIFKQKVVGTPQTFGSFYDTNGEKYCTILVLSKYLGYDIAESKEIQNDKKDTNPAELLPSGILEMIDNFESNE